MQTYSPLLLITPKISQAIYSYREFTKRMDGDLPFYYWTLNERYSDEDLPSFDHCPAFDEDQDLRTHPLRLHRLTINQGKTVLSLYLDMPTCHLGTKKVSGNLFTSQKVFCQIIVENIACMTFLT